MKTLITNRDLYEELQVSKKEKKEQKLRAQVKSRWYYIFWGTATVTVFVGQVFVGNGFRRMSESLDRVLDSPIELDFGIPRHRTGIPDAWKEEGLWHPTDPPIPVY